MFELERFKQRYGEISNDYPDMITAGDQTRQAGAAASSSEQTMLLTGKKIFETTQLDETQREHQQEQQSVEISSQSNNAGKTTNLAIPGVTINTQGNSSEIAILQIRYN